MNRTELRTMLIPNHLTPSTSTSRHIPTTFSGRASPFPAGYGLLNFCSAVFIIQHWQARNLFAMPLYRQTLSHQR